MRGLERTRTGRLYGLDIMRGVRLTDDQYNIPIMRKSDFIPTSLTGFNNALTTKSTIKGAYHFFLDDYQIERVWRAPERYINVLGRAEAALTPDYSLYRDMSKSIQAYNVYRSTKKEGTYTLVGISEGASYVDTQVESDTNYYYKVEATHSTPAANSVLSNPVNVHTPAYRSVYVMLHQVTLYVDRDSSSDSIIIPYMTQVYLDRAVSVSEKGSWYRVYYQNQPYYVWLEAGTEKFTDTPSDFSYKGNTPYQQQVLDLATTIYKEWNTVYAHEQSNGVMNPDGTYGFDCSGLASYLLNTVMQKDIPTYRLTSAIRNFYETDSIYNAGYKGEFCAYDVTMDALQPGDILFFDQQSPIDHCGIYLGNGEFIHASTHWNRVMIMPLSGSYLEDLSGIRRYLPEEAAPANTAVHTNVSYAKLYTKMADSSQVIRVLGEGEEVTLLYTNNGNWAYVRTADGTLGYVLIKYLEP